MDWDEELKKVEKEQPFKLESLKLDFSLFLSQAMAEAELTEQEVAKKIGICEKELVKILGAEKDLKLSEIATICHKLDLSIGLR